MCYKLGLNATALKNYHIFNNSKKFNDTRGFKYLNVSIANYKKITKICRATVNNTRFIEETGDTFSLSTFKTTQRKFWSLKNSIFLPSTPYLFLEKSISSSFKKQEIMFKANISFERSLSKNYFLASWIAPPVIVVMSKRRSIFKKVKGLLN